MPSKVWCEFHSTLCEGCNHLSMTGLETTHASKRGPSTQNRYRVRPLSYLSFLQVGTLPAISPLTVTQAWSPHPVNWTTKRSAVMSSPSSPLIDWPITRILISRTIVNAQKTVGSRGRSLSILQSRTRMTRRPRLNMASIMSVSRGGQLFWRRIIDGFPS